MQPRISIAITMWDRPEYELEAVLYTLSQQTLKPHEIVVADISPVSSNTDRYRAVCDANPMVTYIRSPLKQFSLSRGINIGIKHSCPGSKYVMATGLGMLFSRGALGEIVRLLETDEKAFVVSPCGFLTKGTVPAIDNVYEHWATLVKSVDPNPPKYFSPGTILATSRTWWHAVRGYDESLPFAKADSDVERRVQLDKKPMLVLDWQVEQCLHLWHETSPLVGELGCDFPLTDEIVRNPHGWGEIETANE